MRSGLLSRAPAWMSASPSSIWRYSFCSLARTVASKPYQDSYIALDSTLAASGPPLASAGFTLAAAARTAASPAVTWASDTTAVGSVVVTAAVVSGAPDDWSWFVPHPVVINAASTNRHIPARRITLSSVKPVRLGIPKAPGQTGRNSGLTEVPPFELSIL